MMLSKNSHFDLAIDDSVTVEDVKFADKSVEECGLTSSVWADESDSGLHINLDVDVLHDWLSLRVTDPSISDPQNWSIERWWHREFENVWRVFINLIFHLFFNLFYDFDSGLSEC